MARKVMKEFSISEISGVDFPAQGPALAAIMKRNAEKAGAAGDADLPAPYVGKVGKLPDHVVEYLKRAFTQDQRDTAAGSGAALPDGSFPIENRRDLRNAVMALGRAKNSAKAKAHIVSRARALGASSSLPDSWNVGKAIFKAVTGLTNDEVVDAFSDDVAKFITELADAGLENDAAVEKGREYANCLAEDVDYSCQALQVVFAEIQKDAEVTDKDGHLQESFLQFKRHIQGITQGGTQNTVVKAALLEAGFEITEGDTLAKRGDDAMGFDLKKFLGLPATATDADVEKALSGKVDAGKSALDMAKSALKLSSSHLAYLAKARDPKAKNPMPEADCEKFMGSMSEAERDAYVKANPQKGPPDDENDDDEDMNKSLRVGGAIIKRSVVGDAAFEVMKSQQDAIIKLQDRDEVTEITKRVSQSLTHIGKADETAGLLHRITKAATAYGDATLAKDVEKKLDGLDAVIAKGGSAIFKEIGKNGGGGTADAGQEIESLAQKMIQEGGARNIYKARSLVRERNPELAKREQDERKAA